MQGTSSRCFACQQKFFLQENFLQNQQKLDYWSHIPGIFVALTMHACGTRKRKKLFEFQFLAVC